MVDELKPCPFCGCNLIEVLGVDDRWAHPYNGCLLAGTQVRTIIWNTRAADPEALREIERLEGERDEATREDICPACEGRFAQPQKPGVFCIAGCREGKVRWTSANVLRNVLPFLRAADRRALAAEAQVASLTDKLAKARKGMQLFVWVDPYRVPYGSSMYFAVADTAEEARELAYNGAEFCAYGNPTDPDGYNAPPKDVILGDPSRVVQLPCAEWHEWEE